MTRLAIPSEHTKLKLVGSFDDYEVARVQRLTIGEDIPTTNVYELGNNLMAGTSKDTPNITVSFSIFDVGIRAFSVLTGSDCDNYPAAGVSSSELDEVDVIIYIKDEDVNDYVKTAHARRMQVRDFSFSYSVDGESTEDYTLIGSAKRWFKNDIIVDRFATGTTSFTLSQTPIVLRNGDKLLSVVVDGAYLDEVAAGPGAGEYSVSSTTLTTGTARVGQVLAVYHANPGGQTWAYISDAQMPAAVRGRDVAIKIAAASIPRVQSVTINGNLNVQIVREMGNREIVGYQRQVPTIEGTITVLDTDTELISILTTGNPDSGYTEFQLGDNATVASGIDLVVEILDPTDLTLAYDILKSVVVPNIVTVGDSWSSTVNQNGSWNINFRSDTAECVVYSGSYF
jgi:hypothetical protein